MMRLTSLVRASALALLLPCAIASTAHAQDAQPLTLERAIELALQRGPSARAMASVREAARWRDRSFNARQMPQFSLHGDLPIYRSEIAAITQPDGSQLFLAQQQRSASLALQMTQQVPFTGADLFVSSQVANVNTVGQQETRLWRSTPFQIGLRQQLFKPNNLRWDAKEQDIRLDVAEQQYLETREEIAQRASALFFDVFSTRTALANAEANASVNDTLFTLNKGRFEVGRIGENDLLQSELAVLRSRTRLDGARLAADKSAAALRLYLGLADDAPLDLKVTNQIPTVTIDTVVAVREALKNAADVRNLDLLEMQQKRRVSEARSTGLGASITAGVGYNQSAQTFNDAYHAPLQSKNFSVGVDIPVMQWGARRGQIEAARADQERVESDARLARGQRAQDARYAALALAQAGRQLEIAAKADSVGAKRFDVARNRYIIGRIDISNLFIAQGEKDQALEAYVDALRGYWDAYYRLRRLTLYDFVRNEPIR